MSSIKKPIIFSVEGNIGSGKSTLITYLKDKYKYNNIHFLHEPVDEWNEFKDEQNITILQHFYSDQKKYAFTFQMMAYISRLSAMKKIIKKNQYDIIFTERSIFTDKNVFAQMLFDDNKIDKLHYDIYLKWFNEFIDDIPPIHVIYLKTTPEISYERVKKRAREGEEVIGVEYLKRCCEYHDKWLEKENNIYIIIDGNKNIYKDDNLDLSYLESCIEKHRTLFQ